MAYIDYYKILGVIKRNQDDIKRPTTGSGKKTSSRSQP